MVDRSQDLAPLRAALTQHSAGFMRNTKRIPMTTCGLCTGALKPGFSDCYNCGFTFGSQGADKLGFVAYAWHPHQSGTTMHGYKAPYPAPSSRQTIELMISYAVVGHWSCMDRQRAWASRQLGDRPFTAEEVLDPPAAGVGTHHPFRSS